MRKGWVNYVEIRFITVNVGLARRSKVQDLTWTHDGDKGLVNL